mmetsp:Transcript_27898/g.48240  ORF Transcript_27898/g.48240 Transcript_27898/m.48240 type:complete len:81 (-) Transcript_27898:718-960(-)
MASPAKSATSSVVTAEKAAAVRANDSLAKGKNIYQSLDPLEPAKVAMDIFEVYCREMLMTNFVGRRVFLIKSMRVSRMSH